MTVIRGILCPSVWQGKKGELALHIACTGLDRSHPHPPPPLLPPTQLLLFAKSTSSICRTVSQGGRGSVRIYIIYASVPAQPHTHPSRFIRYLTPPFIQPVSHGFIQAASTHTSRQPPPTYALINTCIYNIHSSVHILHTCVLIRVRAFGAYSDNMQSVLNNDLVFDYLVIPQLDSVTRC